jgi:Holliday junction DNA helicase RuvA
MIARLRGCVVMLGEDHAIIDTAGVGYQVFCHLRTLAALHEQRDGEVILHVHTSVSADAIRLFGFTSSEELRLFSLLISVERIGPKAALGILGRSELPTMVRAIRGGDIALVASVPGIGRKTAERVILELRDKLDGLVLDAQSLGAPPPPHDAASAAVQGLVGLGFRESEARAAVSEVAQSAPDDADVAELVGRALRRLDTTGVTR